MFYLHVLDRLALTKINFPHKACPYLFGAQKVLHVMLFFFKVFIHMNVTCNASEDIYRQAYKIMAYLNFHK